MNEVRHIAELSALLFGLGAAAAFAGRRGVAAARMLLVLATACGAAYLGARYWRAWPMTPMFLGAAGLPPVLGALGLAALRRQDGAQRLFVLRGVLLLGFAVGALAAVFPKDFYLPFIKTISPFAHALLAFGLLGRAALFLCGIHAAAALAAPGAGEDAQRRAFSWLARGFAFWTLSLFGGELWCYAGWGTPVVWEDASIITAMATWFFYVGLIHLHLTRSWSAPARAAMAVAGVGLILVLNCGPDLGPFHPPFSW
ncbi:cytochrome c biogenesis protein CcsA [Oleispirillum naphthae]|uniref:cytochrome c biogenesis protein CcsA n=1 Tax=Oleispirillum naphthae TaxID=2838853 RepID=UPI0030823C73